MRPNYLQRMAESSTRTSAPLRAPAASPPLMPDFAGFPAAEPRFAGEEAEPAQVAPLEPVAQSLEETGPATPPAAPMASAERSAEPRVTAPRPTPESRRSKTPRPHPALPQRLFPQRTVVRWPRLRSASGPVAQRAHEAEAQPQPAPPPPPLVAQSVETQQTPPPAGTTSSAKEQPAAKPRQTRVDSQSPQFERQRVAPAETQSARLPGLQPAPRGDAPVTVSAPAPRRESRIHIGRIDVRLNNRPAVPAPPRPAAAPPRGASNWLEARYLSRFALRP